MSVNTPNMNLIQPTQGVDSGVVWEQSFNSDMGILDGHTHAAGSGVQIQPSGLNISSDLSFQSNNAISLRSTRYVPQASPLSLGTDLGCVYVAGADLYYNDTAGNRIRLTAGGLVFATSSGISSGTASASFSSGVLVVDENTNAPANIQAASYLMGQTGVAGSNYLTLNPPASLSSGSYVLTLPAIGATAGIVLMDGSGNMSVGPTAPASTSFLAMSSAGAVSTPIPISHGITAANCSTNRGVGSGSGSYSNFTSTPTLVDQAVITCTGSGDVLILFVPNSGGTSGILITGNGASASALIYIYKDGVPFTTMELETAAVGIGGVTLEVPPSCVSGYDLTPSAGSHTYAVYASNNVGLGIDIINCTIIVKELL